MNKTIGNPLSWLFQRARSTSHALGDATDALGSHVTQVPQTRTIGFGDIRTALHQGVKDFSRFRSDVIFLIAIYPIIGICLTVLAFDRALLPMIFPLAAGFLLLGPVAAIGLYEMSRQAEIRDDVGWSAVFSVLRAENIGPVLVMALYLLGLFLIWMVCAAQIYAWTLGPEPPTSLGTFLSEVLTTPAGWAMIVVGMSVGFVFAAVVMVVSLITFPMLIDQRVGLPLAVATSVQVARENPVTVAAWGLVVAVLMGLGSLPFFLGLIVVLPILGHATWHLYRAAVPLG